MKISRNWLQSYFDKPIPSVDALADLFTFHAFEVEGIEKYTEKGADDDVLDLKVLPDRAHYALCHRGIATEVSVMTGQPFKADRVPPGPVDSLSQKPEVRVEAPEFCRRYMARYGEIEKVADSNPHACEMLEAIGQRAINAVVDSTNIVMFDIGQPLHIFDADHVKGTIVVRAAKSGEKISLLDSSAGAGREVELLPTDHVIADDLGPLAIAGVKGGKRAGVTASTTHIIIESANFEPAAVRRTATRLDLRSESSRRYENEITPELTVPAMRDVSSLIQYNMPGAKFGPIVDAYPKKAEQTVFAFDPSYIQERLGIAIPLETATGILKSFGLGVEIKSDSEWKLTIPFERLDLTIPDDIVEEVGRIHGYEHVKGMLPPKPEGQLRVLLSYYLSERIKNILVKNGFSEVSLYSLVARGEVETAKPLARDKAFARMNLTDNMLACVEKNALNADLIGIDAVKVFEIGRVFSFKGETLALSLGVAQVKKVKGMNGKKLLMDTLEILKRELGMDIAPTIAEKGAYAVCEIDLASLAKSFAMPRDASYGDLHFGPASTNLYKKISPYPFIVRDIAVFVPESVQAEEVWSAILTGISNSKAESLLARHSLFDTFKKDGKVSYAFRMVFQSMEKTLTDEEANTIMASVNSSMKEKGWEVR